MPNAALRSLAKLLIGLSLGIVLVDVSVGWLEERPASGGQGYLIVPHPVLGWTHRPGYVDQHTRLDSRGLRSPEVAVGVSPSETRVLVVGASQVFGLGVDDDQTWRVQLEAELEGSTPAVRVLNAAVQGYSTVQACRRAMLLIPALMPDLVVVFVYPGRQSLLDPSAAREWVQIRGELVSAELAGVFPSSLKWVPLGLNRLLRHSSLYARHHGAGWRAGEGGIDTRFVLSHAAHTPGIQTRLDQSRRVVEELLAFTNERGIELRLVLLPTLVGSTDLDWERYLELHAGRGAPPVGTPRREPIDALSEWLASTGAVTWDLYDAISYIGATASTHVVGSTRHWSPAGHRIIALALSNCLQEDGVLDRILAEGDESGD